MTRTIPTTEPIDFVAGDTVQWTRSFAEYPASDGWTLKYAFRGAGSLDVAAEPADDGRSFDVVISSQDSSLPAGLYQWAARVENTDDTPEVHTVAGGRITVRPGLANVTDNSQQAHAERALALCEKQIEELLASPVESYTIEQQTTMRRKLAELEGTRNRYKAELSQLRHRGRRQSLAVRFR